MSTNKITPLPEKEWRICKQIIVYDKFNKTECVGHYIYMRKFSEEYNFTEKKSRNATEVIDDLLVGYPNQDSYPHDAIDDLILSTLQRNYSTCTVQNYAIIWNDDRRLRLQDRKKYKSTITLTPLIPQDKRHYYLGQTFSTEQKELNLYSNHLNFSGLIHLNFSALCKIEKINKINKEFLEIEFL